MAEAIRWATAPALDDDVPGALPGVPTRPHTIRPWPTIDVIDGGRLPLRFGEFLVHEGAIDRGQLFRALQMQDRTPGIPIGQCAVALGFLTMSEVEWMYQRFATLLVTIEA
jgi:hypothetical protein